MNEKYLEKLVNVPKTVPNDLLNTIYYLDQKNEKAIAEYLNNVRVDLLLYDNQVDELDYWSISSLKNEINKYDNFSKLSNKEKHDLTKYSVHIMNNKLDKRDFANMQLNQNLPSTVQTANNVYSIEDKIKYYSERIKKADKLKLSSGQVSYAMNFLRNNGIKI